ncbi:MAG: cation transporter [Chloroflexi bacterium]|nr:cation transporter [Chloroflexota bacterium]
MPGVISYTVDLKTDSATVACDANTVTAQEIAQAVAEAGYRAREVVEVR